MSDLDPVELSRLYSRISSAQWAETPILTALKARPKLLAVSYNITSRVKSVQRAAAKLARLRVSTNSAIKVEEISDLLGFRITALFQSHVLDVLSIIMEIMSSQSQIDSIIEQNSLSQVRILSNRPQEDPLSLVRYSENLFNSHGIKPEIYNTPDGYSSIHFIIKCASREDTTKGQIDVIIPVEFQIRTVIEESWGQMSHYLHYGRSGTPNERVRQHLSVMKQVLDSAIQYAELIKNEADASFSSIEFEREKPKSAQSEKESILELPHNLPSELVDSIQGAIKMRYQAQESDEQSSPELFSGAAASFIAINEKLDLKQDLPRETRQKLSYFLKMEQAFCLMYSNQNENIERAIDIYRFILREVKTDILASFRLGSALRRAGNFDEALQFLEATKDLLINNYPTRLSQAHWLRAAVHREVGLVAWLQFRDAADREAKLKFIRDATTNARTGLEVASEIDNKDEILSNANNLLYYTWEEINLDAGPSIDENELRRLLDLIASDITFSGYSERDKGSVIDTACRISVYLKMHGRAVDLAKRSKDILLEKLNRRTRSDFDAIPIKIVTKENLTVDEFDSYLFAQDVLANRP